MYVNVIYVYSYTCVFVGYRTNMEDKHCITLSLSASHPDVAFFGVYDGHSGERAAEFLSEEMHVRVSECTDPLDPALLRAAVIKLDADFCSDERFRTHGATCCFAVVRYDSNSNTYKATVANVGDSRCMVITTDGKLRFVTSDHKPEDEPETKRIKAAGGSVSFGRVDGELAMSRSIGDYNYKGNGNLQQLQQKVIAEPDVTELTIEKGESMIICCDGLVEKLTSEQVVSYVYGLYPEHKKDPATIMAALLDESLRQGVIILYHR